MSSKKNGGKGKQPLVLGRKPTGGQKNKQLPDFSASPKLNSARVEPEVIVARPNQRLGEFTIDRLSHDGRGLTQWKGKTLFVDGALPGEQITARFAAEHGKYAEAHADQILVAAPDRVIPPCIHYSSCGGCQLQHMSDSTQIQFKQQALLEQMQRWAGLVPKYILAPIISPSTGYRSRARLGVWYEEDASVTLGFRQRYSKELTPISTCVVLIPELNRLLAPVTQWLQTLQSAKAVTHVELVAGDQSAGIIFRHIKRLSFNDIKGLQDLARDHGCQIWLQGDKGSSLTDLDGQACDPRLNYELPDFSLALDFHPQDFVQVNPIINRQMVNQALKLLSPSSSERVLDLFCGVGNFTLPLAKACAEVIGVEAADTMVARGRENATRLGLDNASFMAADLTKLSVEQLKQRCGKVDAILLDPPRDGAQEILKNIRQLAAKRIVYVSCNPATLARDAKLLADCGYVLNSLGVLDMFPHTAHVESMALFVRP